MKTRSRRVLIELAVMFVVSVTAGTIYLRLQQHLLRSDVQRTLIVIQALKVGASPVCQLFSEWKDQWRSHLAVDGKCDDPNGFSMDINVQNPPHFWPTCYDSQEPLFIVLGACRVYELLSGNPFVFMVRVEGVQHVVSRKVTQVFVLVPDEDPNEHLPAMITATAELTAKFSPREEQRPSAQQQRLLHPNYRVFVGESRLNADFMPGGRVFFTNVKVGTNASSADSERLFWFDLSCITRMRWCSRGDLMPAAYRQYERDLRDSTAQTQH